MKLTAPYFLGIDIGTQGARVLLMDVHGEVAGSRAEAFPLTEESLREQLPEHWWQACLRSLNALLNDVRKSISPENILAISVTSTSGTVIPLDVQHRPVYNAIMYSDPRSEAAGKLCREAALRFHADGYTGFNASSGISKMIWFGQQFPEKRAVIAHWIHAADYITGRLCGEWGITDYTNALKSGYDIERLEWPGYLYDALSIQRQWLPVVVPSGTPIGILRPSLARELGLTTKVQVTAGMTDGCASQVASGAVNPGNWNTTIGTTLVVKGVTRKAVNDPLGRLYSHRHPDGYRMPGGASNTGADWITQDFADDIEAMNREAAAIIPTNHLAYPLRKRGERFPFIAPAALGFTPAGLTRAEQFAANMEGVAYIERYAFELIENLSGEKVESVFTAGGASKSDTWLKIRSGVLNRPLYKMKHTEGAAGAAMVAASQTYFSSLAEAVTNLAQIEKEISPEEELTQRYDQNYKAFIGLLEKKGYLEATSKNKIC